VALVRIGNIYGGRRVLSAPEAEYTHDLDALEARDAQTGEVIQGAIIGHRQQVQAHTGALQMTHTIDSKSLNQLTGILQNMRAERTRTILMVAAIAAALIWWWGQQKKAPARRRSKAKK